MHACLLNAVRIPGQEMGRMDGRPRTESHCQQDTQAACSCLTCSMKYTLAWNRKPLIDSAAHGYGLPEAHPFKGIFSYAHLTCIVLHAPDMHAGCCAECSRHATPSWAAAAPPKTHQLTPQSTPRPLTSSSCPSMTRPTRPAMNQRLPLHTGRSS